MTDKPIQVLVVDDEPFMIRLIGIVLERDGYRMLQAADGQEAVDLARRVSPDLIIMDGMMPRLDGLKAIELLKAEPLTREIPVILLTANPNRYSREAAVSIGATVFLTKPFSPTQLLEEIRKLRRTPGPRSDSSY